MGRATAQRKPFQILTNPDIENLLGENASPLFPDGTLFINRKVSKVYWCVVSNGDLMSFGGHVGRSKKASSHKLLTRLSGDFIGGWFLCHDIKVIYTGNISQHQSITEVIKHRKIFRKRQIPVMEPTIRTLKDVRCAKDL
ncbi:hypothetical protein [Vibrio mediterranei]|uniref:Uncharacterized protein n=1 Tax=Vibrio mediterranei TaxID=689 RepID=A0AAN1KNP0_9VIBR|nr:hypothetical protein [Vibrio mediterranei]ASI90691.1 hypothetical protein BSZ05_13355 [Vibrio mediterranei]